MQKFAALTILILSCEGLYSQTVSISTTKTNVFYRWTENPLQIVIENNSCKNIIIKADIGKITGSNCEYTYTVLTDTAFYDVIYVGLQKHGKTTWLSKTAYPIKELPDPVVQIGSFNRSGNIPINYILSQTGLRIPVPYGFCSFPNEKIQELKSYSVKIVRGDSVLFSQRNIAGNLFDEVLTGFIKKNCRASDKIIFYEFVCILYEKEIRQLKQELALTIKVN